MRFKLDENLHTDAAELLRRNGHEALTVSEQAMRGKDDSEIAEVCRQEARTIVTLDLDFSNIRDYPPETTQGILVLRLRDQSRPAVLDVLRRVLPLFETEPLTGCLWIVDERQVRIRGGGSKTHSTDKNM